MAVKKQNTDNKDKKLKTKKPKRAKAILIEDTSTVEARKDKNKKRILAASVLGAFAILAIIGGICVYVFNQETHLDEKEAIKEVYEAVHVDLGDDDFEIVDDQVEVKEEKKQEARKNSVPVLEKVVSYTTPQNVFDNTPEVQPEKEDEISIEDVTKKMNVQLSLIKGYMDRSFQSEYYAEPLKQLIKDIKDGNLEGEYDYHTDLTNEKAFGVLCSLVDVSVLQYITDGFWNNMGLYSMQTSDVLKNIILKEAYNEPVTVDVLAENSSKTYNFMGEEIKNAYIALCGNRTFFLDANLNILDIQ